MTLITHIIADIVVTAAEAHLLSVLLPMIADLIDDLIVEAQDHIEEGAALQDWEGEDLHILILVIGRHNTSVLEMDKVTLTTPIESTMKGSLENLDHVLIIADIRGLNAFKVLPGEAWDKQEL